VHTFALPRTNVAARLVLTAGTPATGAVFVMDRAANHDGPETVLDMLNRAEAFFPFRPEARAEAVLLIAKAHTVLVEVEGVPFADPVRAQAAQTADLEVVLEGGSTITGRAQFELPDAHRRLLDFLNASQHVFFAVTAGNVTSYVNRSHVLYARQTS
jgi:hypothetical protein